MARTNKTETALRRIVERKAPVRTKLAALAQMRQPSAKWLAKIASAEATHPKVAVRVAEMLRTLEEDTDTSSLSGIDPRLAAFLTEAESDAQRAEEPSTPKADAPVQKTDGASGETEARPSQQASTATIAQRSLIEDGRALAHGILTQRARCATAPLNRAESDRLRELQAQFGALERAAAAEGLDLKVAVRDITERIELLRPPVEPIQFQPRRQLGIADHLRIRAVQESERESVHKRTDRLRKRQHPYMPTCGTELND
ncbi:MAG TPA: hypothetical protein VEJ46_11900 [Candidatus Acidoferrum sp.]|nr:hypothetical protein [Candidatus Acidoferrum sp.]